MTLGLLSRLNLLEGSRSFLLWPEDYSIGLTFWREEKAEFIYSCTAYYESIWMGFAGRDCIITATWKRTLPCSILLKLTRDRSLHLHMQITPLKTASIHAHNLIQNLDNSPPLIPLLWIHTKLSLTQDGSSISSKKKGEKKRERRIKERSSAHNILDSLRYTRAHTSRSSIEELQKKKKGRPLVEQQQ